MTAFRGFLGVVASAAFATSIFITSTNGGATLGSIQFFLNGFFIMWVTTKIE